MANSTEHAAVTQQGAINDSYDVVVIGGGPGGSATAALLAEFGHDVLLLERANFPRFHVGESLVPETYWPLKRLGLIDRLKASAFPKKFSVQFISGSGKESAPFYFDDYKDHESSQTWQVWRDAFDQMLLDNAIENGATARTNTRVTEVVFDENDRATGVQVISGDGDQQTSKLVNCKVVVDATGQSAFLATRLGVKTADAHLKKGTIWTYFRGAWRDPGKDEGATLVIQTQDNNSWFWYIPLTDDIVSVGCTGAMDYMFQQGRGTPAEVYAQELARCPGLQRRLQNAEQCREFHTTKDFSYSATQGAGDGWVLVGDAFGFIDPVYSSGVLLALKSGEFAADAIHDALENNDCSAARLGSWQPKHRTGVAMFRKLVYAFYTPGFSFGDFLRKHPQFRNHLVDILIGDVYKPGLEEMFEVMGNITPSSTTPAPAME